MKTLLHFGLMLAAISPLAAQIEVTSTGVGIGTTTPARKFDVGGGTAYSLSGAILPTMQVVGSGGNNGTYGGAYFVTQSSDSAGGLLVLAKARSDTIGTLTAVQAGDVLGAIHFFGADGSTLIRGARIISTAEGNASTGALAANLTFATSTGNSYTEHVRLTSGGNVGIGTTAPLSKLHVMGVGRFGYNDAGTNNIGGILVASGTGSGGARQYWIGASDPTAHNNNMFEISDYNGSTNSPLLTIYGTHAGSSAGYVGIGTTSPGYKLHVVGSVRATSFISDSTTYADFVFKPDYKLASLTEVEAHIADKGHLPGIPSEAEAKANGIDLAAMQVKLLQKVEELTLYVIELGKTNADQSGQIQSLQAEVRRLQASK